MIKNQKVVWYEGMKLDPHHFQQNDKYFHYLINSRMNAITQNDWGFKELQIDVSSLAKGNFGLVKCSGIMPDGLVFNMPVNDPLPKVRSFEGLFPATEEKLEVFLAIPTERITGNNCQLTDEAPHNPTRFTIQNIDVLDDNSGVNLRNVGMVRSNFFIRFGDESMEDFTSIKICEINRVSSGTYALNKDFIPTSVSISASEVLQNYINEILGALVSKGRELQYQLVSPKKEITITDIEILMLYQTVNTYIPNLNQFHNCKNLHPESVYTFLLSLGGQLTTFSYGSQIQAQDFLPYDHKNITTIFKQIYDQLMTLLRVEKKIIRRDINIPLKKQTESLYIGQLADEHIAAQLFLIVKSEMPESKVVSGIPKNIKIAAGEEILAVHQAGIQGVSLSYVARPPAGLSEDPQLHYFRINKEGRFWDKVVDKKSIAFFLASEYISVKMELVALMPGK
ncbi:MAG: type VI secretion system baseplate subunit TssK [bacterium]